MNPSAVRPTRAVARSHPGGRTYLDAAFVEWLRAEGTQAARFDSFLPQPGAVR